jgi:hypothetical protein
MVLFLFIGLIDYRYVSVNKTTWLAITGAGSLLDDLYSLRIRGFGSWPYI